MPGSRRDSRACIDPAVKSMARPLAHPGLVTVQHLFPILSNNTIKNLHKGKLLCNQRRLEYLRHGQSGHPLWRFIPPAFAPGSAAASHASRITPVTSRRTAKTDLPPHAVQAAKVSAPRAHQVTNRCQNTSGRRHFALSSGNCCAMQNRPCMPPGRSDGIESAPIPTQPSSTRRLSSRPPRPALNDTAEVKTPLIRQMRGVPSRVARSDSHRSQPGHASARLPQPLRAYLNL